MASSPDNSARRRVLRRAAKLRALASDKSNANEAAAARVRLDALISKWDFTDADFAEVREKPRPRHAGKTDETTYWKDALALAVAKIHGCKALKAKGNLFFEGDRSVDALVQFRKVSSDLERRADLGWLVVGYDPRLKVAWLGIFLYAAAIAFGDVGSAPNYRSTAGAVATDVREIYRFNYAHFLIHSANEMGHAAGVLLARGEEHASVRAAEPPPPGRHGDETFAMSPGIVAVRSNYPGNYASLFLSDGARHHIAGHLCRFDDARGDYVWVFQCTPPDGSIVFATARRAAVAEVLGGLVQAAPQKRAKIDRDVNGTPLRVLEIAR